jgi:hypothetical protein
MKVIITLLFLLLAMPASVAALLEEGPLATSCTPSDSVLCLNQDRFRVEIGWKDFNGATGPGRVVPFGSDDSGLMWFFSPNNWEVLVKVLDGCGINNRFWVFAAATTNVEYRLRVTDTVTGAVKTYDNPLGVRAAAITDTSAFSTCGGSLAADGGEVGTERNTLAAAPESTLETSTLDATTAVCVPSATTLCLGQGRFAVRVTWADFHRATGPAKVVPVGSVDSGLFYFFEGNNWEMLIKVLDGCALNGHFWVFSAATTNVAYTLEVTDTATGLVRNYTNRLGVSAPAITDTSAFGTCTIPTSLPPDPGASGTATIAGVDRDGDGIRDEIQRYIAFAYAGKPAHIAAMRQTALALQASLVGANSLEGSHAGAGKTVRALECIFATDSEQAAAMESALFATFIDTEQRFNRYRLFLGNLEGQSFATKKEHELSSSCTVPLSGFSPDQAIGSAAEAFRATPGCGEGKAAVYFGNGIWTTFGEGISGTLQLQRSARLRNQPELDLETTTFALAYNPTENFIADLWEATRQKIAEELRNAGNSGKEQSQFQRYRAGRIVQPRYFQDDVEVQADRSTETVVLADPVAVNHLALYKRDILEGREVVLVAHSQGNFFGNEVWRGLTEPERLSFTMVSVANPSSYNLSGGLEVNLAKDLVIFFVRGFVANAISNATAPPDTLGHSFEATYLENGSFSQGKIVTGVAAALAYMPTPVAQAADGAITVTLTWNNSTDVDLHVFEPNGTHVYYRNQNGTSGELDIDDTSGHGPEHFFVQCGRLLTGTYLVGVNYYSGSVTETANIQVRAGTEVRSFLRVLQEEMGSAGDANPQRVAKIQVSGSPEAGYEFAISEW